MNHKKELRQKKRRNLNSDEDFQGFAFRGIKNNPQIQDVILYQNLIK